MDGVPVRLNEKYRMQYDGELDSLKVDCQKFSVRYNSYLKTKVLSLSISLYTVMGKSSLYFVLLCYSHKSWMISKTRAAATSPTYTISPSFG